MKKLKIAQVAPIWYPVPPKKYGGIERIVSSLTEELARRGHEVTLFASGDSKTSARLVSIRQSHLAKSKVSWSDNFWELENIALAFSKARDFDIVHCHIGPRAVIFQRLIKTPVLHTFHNPLTEKGNKLSPLFEVLKNQKENTRAVFISKRAREICPINFSHSWVVYNGINVNLFKFNPAPKDYFVWAGRVEAYKGVENAIKAARLAGVKLYLAGKLDPERKFYFEKNIKPYLSEKIKYLGELSQKQLSPLFQGALACLYPIEWEEPFGLVMAEVQACGTPVIAFDLGSVPEVVRNGKTGFVVPFFDKNGSKNFSGLIEAIKNIDKIKRINCRQWVEARFTIGKMAENYENVYYEILGRS